MEGDDRHHRHLDRDGELSDMRLTVLRGRAQEVFRVYG